MTRRLRVRGGIRNPNQVERRSGELAGTAGAGRDVGDATLEERNHLRSVPGDVREVVPTLLSHVGEPQRRIGRELVLHRSADLVGVRRREVRIHRRSLRVREARAHRARLADAGTELAVSVVEPVLVLIQELVLHPGETRGVPAREPVGDVLVVAPVVALDDRFSRSGEVVGESETGSEVVPGHERLTLDGARGEELGELGSQLRTPGTRPTGDGTGSRGSA